MKYTNLVINTDGGSRGNPGPAAVGVVTVDSTSQIIFEISEYIGETTNNVAEYTAVIKALNYLITNHFFVNKLTFVLDSELIVRQISGVYRIKEPHLQTLAATVHQHIQTLKSANQINEVKFTNVLRNQNKHADMLVNRALDNLIPRSPLLM